MNPGEKRTYHHGDLRNALVTAAVAAAREHGPGAVVLRDVARQVGVSHNAGYRHFASRDELLGAVAEVGLAELAAGMRRGLQTAPRRRDPIQRVRERLRAIGRAYVRFAIDEPGLFRTVWAGAAFGTMSGPADSDPYQILNDVLDEFVECGAIPNSRRPFSEVAAWAGVHGLSSLVIDGLVTPAEIDAALDRLCDVIDAGL